MSPDRKASRPDQSTSKKEPVVTPVSRMTFEERNLRFEARLKINDELLRNSGSLTARGEAEIRAQSIYMRYFLGKGPRTEAELREAIGGLYDYLEAQRNYEGAEFLSSVVGTRKHQVGHRTVEDPVRVIHKIRQDVETGAIFVADLNAQ